MKRKFKKHVEKLGCISRTFGQKFSIHCIYAKGQSTIKFIIVHKFFIHFMKVEFLIIIQALSHY